MQPQACGKNNRMSIAAACTLSLPCTRLTCLRGGGGMGRCVAAARARRLVCAQIKRIECPSPSAARMHRQYKVRVQRASVARAAAELV